MNTVYAVEFTSNVPVSLIEQVMKGGPEFVVEPLAGITGKQFHMNGNAIYAIIDETSKEVKFTVHQLA